VREEDDSLAGPLGIFSHAAALQPTSSLGLSNPRVAKAWICSSITMDGSQTVFGAGTCAGSIFSSSTPVDLDLKTTSVLVRMCECVARRT
jgi:hypothetical protein